MVEREITTDLEKGQRGSEAFYVFVELWFFLLLQHRPEPSGRLASSRSRCIEITIQGQPKRPGMLRSAACGDSDCRNNGNYFSLIQTVLQCLEWVDVATRNAGWLCWGQNRSWPMRLS